MSNDEKQQVRELTTQEEIGALCKAHQFFSDFPNVPGNLAAAWGSALDSIAIAANSLISKAGLASKPSGEEENREENQ